VLLDGQVSPFPDRDPPKDNQAHAEPRTRLADPEAAPVAAPAAAPVIAPVAAPVAEPTPARSPHPRAVNFRRGFTEEHQLCFDVTSAGKLPADFCSLKVELSTIREYHTLDYRPSGIQPSHFCQGGGMGLFFQVPTKRTLSAGSLIGVYHGQDTTLLKLTASEAQKRFRGSDYVFSCGPGEYVVDGRPFKEQN
jgi:hypothetical protein